MGKIQQGFFGIKGGKKEAGIAAKHFSRAEAMSDEQLARNKSYLEEWEKVFGPIQDSVVESLNNLSADTLAARQLASFEEEYVGQLDSIKQNFTKRFGEGVTASGLAEAGEITAKLNAASIRARVKADAEAQVLAQKQQFLTVGLNQQAQLRGNLNQAFQNASGVSLNIGAGYQRIGAQKDQNVAAFRQGIFDKVSSAALAAAGAPPSGAETTTGQQNPAQVPLPPVEY